MHVSQAPELRQRSVTGPKSISEGGLIREREVQLLVVVKKPIEIEAQ